MQTPLRTQRAGWVRFLAPFLAAFLCVGPGADFACAAEAGKPIDWWSLKPLARPSVPEIKGAGARWVRNPIDAFVLAKQREKSLQPSPETERRALIRRLYFDLIGLPPSPEQVDAFIANRDPRAYENLVDHLLASGHYGERWARHWLDVVHYGDTHGYDKDKPRPHAWPYRDYVIRAFNADRPYSRFVQEQLAGDVLFPGTRNGVEAMGFIAAGPWDLIGHVEVPETKIDGKVARNLDRDDMVANAMNTFASITVQCARCHDHKFDPVTQEDYYRLQAVFAALDRADKQYFADPALTRRFNELDHRQRSLNDRQRQIEKKLADAAGNELVELDKRIAEASKAAKGNERAEFGYHSAIETTQVITKWVQVDLGRNRLVDRVVLVPCHDDFNNIGDGFGFPVRYKVEVSEEATFPADKVAVLHESKSDESNPGLAEQVIPAFGAVVRYVRVTAAKLAPRKNDFIFALAELRVLDGNGANQTRGAVVSALDSIEAPPRWRKSNLVDDIAPASQSAGELAQLRASREALLASAGDADTRNELAALKKELQEVAAQLKKFPPPDIVYAGTVHYGSGNFKGTGSEGARPRPIHLLKRGDVNSPGSEVGPGALACLAGLPGEFKLPPGHAEGERRAALARWLTDARNPLTWRSIVNRVWQYHFGRGIVETPNDFGRMGAPPTHPELLDWLAVEFRDGGQSLKQLHRLILTSATYRQSSVLQAGTGALAARPSTLDADNRYYWRMNRRKLEAEALRDAVLLVSGKLDERMYGPGFQDFVIEKPEHSPHYQYDLHDPDDPKSHRRSIYRFIVRSQMQPFMTSLDCADPSIQVARRNESVSSLQALALLNNGFMVTMAKHFAAKLEAGGGDLEKRAERAFKEALGRPPSVQERDALVAYARQHGLANACRVVFNLNEFLFVD